MSQDLGGRAASVAAGTATRILALGLDATPAGAGGGLTRYLRDLTRHLALSGAEVVSVVTGATDDVDANVVVSGPPTESLVRRLVKYCRTAQRVGGRSELIDVHFAPYAFLPLSMGRLRRIPYVVHFQGPWAAESRTSGAGRLESMTKRLIERRVYRGARHIVVLSQAFRDLLVSSYFIVPSQITVIPPGVDLSLFAPGDRDAARRQLGLPVDGRIVVSVRRLVPRVGLEVLIDAMGLLRAQGEQLQLVVVGDGPQRDALAERARDVGLGTSARFLGAVDESELVAAYRAADVCVVPTVAYEGFGLVVLESLACGVPVVASAIEGLTEAVSGLDPSLLVPPRDAPGLAGRLRAGFFGPKPWPEPAACRDYAETFSWPEIALRNRRVYDGALVGARATARLRVVILDHCGRLSGAEIALVRLIEALGDRVEAHVILAEDGPLVPRLRSVGAVVSVLPLQESARGLARNRITPRALPWRDVAATIRYTLRLARRLRKLRPDVVQTSSLKADLYGGVAARLAGLPLVWHMHDRIAEDYLPRPAVWLIRGAARWLPHEVVANSTSTLSALRPGAGRGVVIPYALPPSGHSPSRPPPLGPLRFGLVGRLSPWKGQDLFLNAFAAAFATGFERAVIVGAALFDEASIEEDLHRQAMDLGVGDRVEFRGFREDVNFELSRIDVLVHASRIPEPFGQVVTEGMAAGLAVVATDAGGPAEIITHGVDGMLYPIGDCAALAALLRRLADDAALRSRLGSKAKQRAADFGGERVAAQFLDVYARVQRNGPVLRRV